MKKLPMLVLLVLVGCGKPNHHYLTFSIHNPIDNFLYWKRLDATLKAVQDKSPDAITFVDYNADYEIFISDNISHDCFGNEEHRTVAGCTNLTTKKIYIEQDYFDESNVKIGDCLVDLLAHEIGHANGLVHTPDKKDIMYWQLNMNCWNIPTNTWNRYNNQLEKVWANEQSTPPI